MVEPFNQRDFNQSNKRIQGEFSRNEDNFYRPKGEKIFNRDFLNMLALTITIPTIICVGISNYQSYSKATRELEHYSSSQLKTQILNSEYTGVKSLDLVINKIGVLPGLELALRNKRK